MDYKYTLIFILGFLSLLSMGCNSTLRTISPEDFGCKPNVKVNNRVNMQKFFDHASVLKIPAGEFLVHGDLNLTGVKKLELVGSLKGSRGNERIFVDGDIEIFGSGELRRMSLEIQGGSIIIRDIKFVQPGKSAAILINNDEHIIDNFLLDGVEIVKGPYGLMRQGAYGEMPVKKAIIRNNYIHDCRGDGIEWNVGNRDGRIEILNNRVENIDADFGGKVGKAWGMGIGVAGAVYKEDFSNCVSDFLIEGNIIKNVRHGIHVEAGKDFIIRNNIVETANVSKKGNLKLVGIVITGSKDYLIENNTVVSKMGYAMMNSFGSLPKIGYICSPTNYRITNNEIRGRIVNWCCGDNNSIHFTKNKVWGDIIHHGRAQHYIKDNTFYKESNTSRITVNAEKIKGRRNKYQAKKENIILDVSNNFMTNSSKEISPIIKK